VLQFLRVLENLFASGLAVESNHLPQIYNAGFDGLYTYFASNSFVYGSRPSHWNSMSKYCKEREMLFIPSVGPGYIDTEVLYVRVVGTII